MRLDPNPDGGGTLDDALAARLEKAFAAGAGAGLLHLGATEVEASLPPELAYFRDLGRAFVARVCTTGDIDAAGLDDATRARFLLSLPPLRGAEYLDAERLASWWGEMAEALRAEASAAGSLDAYLAARGSVWHLVGRVHVHLAETKRDPERPFAFLATYTTGVQSGGKVQHAPLGQALRQHAGDRNRRALVALLAPLERAAARCAWLRALVDSGQVYQPLAWTPAEALAFLQDAAAMEEAGLVVRVPELWRERRPPRAEAQITIGGKPAAGLGYEGLLDFQVQVAVGGEPLSPAEVKELLAGGEGLRLLRGRWVEVDGARLAQVLAHWKEAERAHAEGLPFHEALRLVSGAPVASDTAAPLVADAAPVRVVAGPWLAETLSALRSPEGAEAADPAEVVQAQLRPYQAAGVRWLWWLRSLGLGGCLADDMGLGKTLQVIALFALCARQKRRKGRHLVVAPASLLGNWRAEIARFAPQLRVVVAHPSELSADEIGAALDASETDVVLTSYGTLVRLEPLRKQTWDVVVADEAQAIKNPGTKQARAVRALTAGARFALTGTPVENRIGDLWSIFAFSSPGLLGNEREFSKLVKQMEGGGHDAYGPLRALVRPYILRRLKTQKDVIADLPDKTEMLVPCGLSRKQAALYTDAVRVLKEELGRTDGIARRGLVLASLTKLKQICNHPSHWLGDGAWDPGDSGKMERLGALADEIAARQEKMLVFTQFKEATEPLAAFLARRFGRTGLVLSGETAVAKRQKLVERFQAEDGPPFFVLSLRAGGTGLTLTAASHVVHFDRWWNPAVEDQATDRAFRIGQKRNVLVHKLVCRGTLEERIDALISGKRDLARQIVEGEPGAALSELSNDEIMRLVSLDVRSALTEAA